MSECWATPSTNRIKYIDNRARVTKPNGMFL